MSRAARLCLAFALIGLTSCAQRPENVFIAEGPNTVSGASQVEMLVATTRRPSSVPGEMFGGERGDPAFADISISIPPDKARKVGEVEWPKSIPADPKREFSTIRATLLKRDAVIADFHERLGRGPSRKVLVFVHGYNSRFDDAVFRFAQIVHDSGAKDVPVLFTWPSRGKLLAYAYDRESANYSRDGLEATLNYLVQDSAVSEVSILAHSMGNWVTLEALRQMGIRKGGISPKIKNVMLASPDVDVDVFRTQLDSMGPRRPRLTLFVSNDDKALKASRWLWGSTARLGTIDPTVEPYKHFLETEKIDVVDLSHVKTSDRLNHGKFAESPEVIQLIGRQLATGQPITDQQLSVADRIVGGVDARLSGTVEP
ncbi:alpha/beta hydrolase [Mesorhizobium sp. B1-1-8]|uniref:alpha/beta hydrolase n=1 Tax=Mesorhizobium sp. B1-1-8 TaxID=2589976 RepID=UPI00112B6F53|nr:alpha/beta hydrolase [Mesorhizobium sp. B1-1-8]UCI05659.1 alpha/beta hydrolase [Mesorhizobium sp. B1-1-8]